MERNDLKGKVVLIAGGAKNLGGLLSRTVASKGAKVAILYNSDSTKSDAEQTLSDIQNAGGEAILFQGDLTKAGNITRFFDETIHHFGRIDIAINKVGMVLKKPFEQTTNLYHRHFLVSSLHWFVFYLRGGKSSC
jgi:NAD(P)-dependent dehydrogenase (short-subunit alcohol dehydrogenase family)